MDLSVLCEVVRAAEMVRLRGTSPVTTAGGTVPTAVTINPSRAMATIAQDDVRIVVVDAVMGVVTAAEVPGPGVPGAIMLSSSARPPKP